MTEKNENLTGFPKGMTLQEFAARQRKTGRMFPFTMQDIVDAVGKSIHTVRRDKGLGRFDPQDLRSLSNYIVFSGTKQTEKKA